jgi:hypothetical protein
MLKAEAARIERVTDQPFLVDLLRADVMHVHTQWWASRWAKWARDKESQDR